MQSDNGSQFVSDIVKSFVKDYLKARSKLTPAYTAAANGRVERVIGTVKNALICAMMELDTEDWVTLLLIVTQLYNCSMHSTLQEMPFVLFRGFTPETPEVVLAEVPNELKKLLPKESRYSIMQREANIALEALTQKENEAVEKAKLDYAKNIEKSKKGHYVPHNFVFVKVPLRQKCNLKNLIRYRGPFEIMERNTNTVKLKISDEVDGKKITDLWHLSRLKPYRSDDHFTRYRGKIPHTPFSQEDFTIIGEDNMAEPLDESYFSDEFLHVEPVLVQTIASLENHVGRGVPSKVLFRSDSDSVCKNDSFVEENSTNKSWRGMLGHQPRSTDNPVDCAGKCRKFKNEEVEKNCSVDRTSVIFNKIETADHADVMADSGSGV